MALAVSFQAPSALDNTSLTTYTFSAKAIGPVTTDRIVVLLVYLNQGTNSKTATATCDCGDGSGAVAMTSQVQGFNASETCAIFTRNCPAGNTTADFVITGSGSSGDCGIGIYCMTGDPNPIRNDFGTSSAANPTKNLSTQNGGASFAVGGTRGATSWTPTNITEDFDTQLSNGTICGDSGLDAGTSRNVTLTPAASSIPIGAFVAFITNPVKIPYQPWAQLGPLLAQ